MHGSLALTNEEPLWRPSPQCLADDPLTLFTAAAEKRTGLSFPDYGALHAGRSKTGRRSGSLLWDFAASSATRASACLIDGDKMPGAMFLPRRHSELCRKLLRKQDDTPTRWSFAGRTGRSGVSAGASSRAGLAPAAGLPCRSGVGPGDRVAALLPNMPETIAAMLATASLGAVWSSASPDFGRAGVLDRFGQIEPKLFLAGDGYCYAGKDDRRFAEKLAEIVAGLPSASQPTDRLPYLGSGRGGRALAAGRRPSTACSRPTRPKPLTFERLPFAHPLYILFSSGTTGIPKCIVHARRRHAPPASQGASAALRASKPGERLFYFTTCGWMMWNWLASGLASGATLLLFDGSPFHPIAAAPLRLRRGGEA